MGEDAARPTSDDDRDGWKAYWAAQGMLWRTEPEIDTERQAYLSQRRAVQMDIEQGYFPFRDESGSIKLNRADVEWLLATHESEGLRGPVEWSDQKQRQRKGLDLRAADLTGVALNGLPLARTLAGFNDDDDFDALFDPVYGELKVDETDDYAWESTIIPRLERTFSQGSKRIQGPLLRYMELFLAAGAHLEGANLAGAHLEGANLHGVHLESALLESAHLNDAKLNVAILSGADLSSAHLEGADLSEALLRGFSLDEDEVTRIRQAIDFPAILYAANLQDAYFDERTILSTAKLGDARYGWVKLKGIHWGTFDLAQIRWEQIRILGEESEAHQARFARNWTIRNPSPFFRTKIVHRLLKKPSFERLREYETAVRAYRQLTTAMRGQGLIEQAYHFAYRGNVVQREVLRRQGRWLRYLGSLILDLMSGYGYRPLRSVATYVITIAAFAALYWCVTNDVSLTQGLFTHTLLWLGMKPPPTSAYHLQGYEAVVVSMTSFHGRGFFQPSASPGDKVAILSAIEAALGLLIEIVFIATFTQRFFAR